MFAWLLETALQADQALLIRLSLYQHVCEPILAIHATSVCCVCPLQLAGRLLKYSYHIARVSSWIEQRMRAAITKTMVRLRTLLCLRETLRGSNQFLPLTGFAIEKVSPVLRTTRSLPCSSSCLLQVFPGGGDLLLLPLMGLEHPNAADPLPALGRYMQQAAAMAQQQREEQRREEQQAAAARDKEQEQQQEQQQQAEEQEQQEQQGPAEIEQPLPDERPAAAAEPQRPLQAALPAAHAVGLQPAAESGFDSAAAAEAQPQPAANGAPQAAAPQLSSAAPAQDVGAAATSTLSGGGEAAEQWSESQEALLQEPSLSNLPSPQQATIAAVAGAAAAGRPGSAGTASGGPAAASNGHLISQRYRSSSEGGERVGSPGFQGWPATSAARAAEWKPSGGRSAEDAWDAAIALEAADSTREAPTPKFGSGWQSAPGSAGGQRVVVDAARAGSLPADPLGALQQQRQQQQRGAVAPPSDPLPVPAPRAGLQLRLSAMRSLDPDFTSSAERTGFGESPVEALPDYSSAGVRRTLSAATRAAGGAGSQHGGGGSATKKSVGASLNRSLEYLRRQSISSAPGSPVQQQQQQQQQQHDAGNLAQAAGPRLQQQVEHAGARPPQQLAQQSAGSPQQQAAAAASSPRQDSVGSPSDSSRMRQQGSFKEQAGKSFGSHVRDLLGGLPKQQGSNLILALWTSHSCPTTSSSRPAGKLFTRMNTAGKALASQVQQMQQQRAAQRAAAQAGSGSMRRSTGAEAPSPLRDGL